MMDDFTIGEVYNNAGEPVNFANHSSVAQLFLDTVPDPVTRSILFGTWVDDTPKPEDVHINGAGIIIAMRSIVSLAYTIALTLWRQLDSDDSWGYEEHINYFKNARFSRLFQSALGNEDITLDLKIFSLIELWVGLKKAPNLVCGCFANFFNDDIDGDDIGLTLQRVREYIHNATFKVSDLQTKYTTVNCNWLCYKLLNSFMVFRAVKIKYPTDAKSDAPDDFVIEYARNFAKRVLLYPNKFGEQKFLVTQEQLRCIKNPELVLKRPARLVKLFMLSETSAFDGKYQYTYRSFDGESETRIESQITTDNSDSAEEGEDGGAIDTEAEIREMRKFLTFNYKNLRDFALVISDAIKDIPAKKQLLFSICKEKYPRIIADLKGYDAPNIYWDNIITLMLVEMGFRDFLELILDDDTVFGSIMNNIGWRCKGRDAVEHLKSYQQDIKTLEETQRNKRQSKRNLEMRKIALRTKYVLMSMDLRRDDDDTQQESFEESLSTKYNDIMANLNTLRQNHNKVENMNYRENIAAKEALKSSFKNIFMLLQVFYEGLNRYAFEKNEWLKHKTSEDGPHGYRKQCFEAFQKAALSKLKKIREQSLTEVFDGFCDLCASYNTYNAKDEFNISDKAKLLKQLITRNYICDVKKLRYFATIEHENGETSSIFELLESEDRKFIESERYAEWLTYFQDLFLFLIYNEDYSEKGYFQKCGGKLKDKDCDPIYPYIVTYYRENIDRDQLKKCTYRVPIPTDGGDENSDGLVVTLLMEEDYRPDTYFCIPLRYGSSESWWINPFMIPTHVLKERKKQ